MDWSLLLMALGLALILEGLPYFLFPDRALRLAQVVQSLGPEVLRTLGFAVLLAGVMLLVLGRWYR